MGKYNLFRGTFKEEKVRLMQGFTGPVFNGSGSANGWQTRVSLLLISLNGSGLNSLKAKIK